MSQKYVGKVFNIISQQSTAKPGCIIELDAITDFVSICLWKKEICSIECTQIFTDLFQHHDWGLLGIVSAIRYSIHD